ncbi:MAG: hypothetical protein ACRDJC_23595 [Thermomicrobiales bacterium]
MAPALAAPAIVSAQDAETPDRVATDIRYILPFTPDGLHPDLTATATAEAGCIASSTVALGRPDAWSCLTLNPQIHDPCFENPFLPPAEQSELACFASPFTADVVLVTLTGPLVREKGPADPVMPDPIPEAGVIGPWDLPWALELANGDRCTLLHGTLTVMAGHVIHYGCVDQGMVLGEVDNGQPVWTVHYLAAGDFSSTRVDVVVAWS